MSTDTQTNGGSPALELKGLCKSFGGLQATRDVTLRIMPGDRKAIIGPNGAGKTTLFNLITGIYPGDRRARSCCSARTSPSGRATGAPRSAWRARSRSRACFRS